MDLNILGTGRKINEMGMEKKSTVTVPLILESSRKERNKAKELL